ncbi:TBC1 domain family member 8 [Nymphaea thermarum]|nr:TBC1 domain family member 8 [Nymphaea thermarum]
MEPLGFGLLWDAYGFAVRPQHLQRYREYANIYKEEEEERSERWDNFLENLEESAQLLENGSPSGSGAANVDHEVTINDEEGRLTGNQCISFNGNASEKDGAPREPRVHKVQIWTQVRPLLRTIEHMMCARVGKGKVFRKIESDLGSGLAIVDEKKQGKQGISTKTHAGASEEDSEEEFYDVERSDPVQDANDNPGSATSSVGDVVVPETFGPWREELECLVHGGVPMALRGELWQAFVGVKARRIENYYTDLLAVEDFAQAENADDDGLLGNDTNGSTGCHGVVPEKWKGQIEKDLPRTFPGHPALDEDGRNALRRLLIAYARHNPLVGYCQAMNFFAGLLLLLMPEENAFWTLMGIIDEYFDGYYSEEMIESQVDQLVLEELVRQRFPKLVNHLDYLGVQVAWVTGPWFLTIFVNMLPWESVLRVWDVLLFDGNRVMLFRTALALMELYGPALVTTKDAGDAVTLLQSLAGSTFDSSQLVLTACMGYQAVTEAKLQELRTKHRPTVIAAIDERSKELRLWRDSQGLASKLYSFNQERGSVLPKSQCLEGSDEMHENGTSCLLECASTNVDELICSLTGETDSSSGPDLQEQVTWLKVELCRLLEEKRAADLRAEELETALMEMVKQDNRRLLSAKVEQLEGEVKQLRQSLADKQEQEHVMLQVLMRVEQEQKVTEDARRFAEQDAAAQRYAADVLQEKYEAAIASLAEMEKRAVMAETTLEATLQYQSGQVKATQPSTPSPRASPVERVNHEPTQELPTRKPGLLSRPFGLGWRERNKGKMNNNDEGSDDKPIVVEDDPKSPVQKDINGH